MVPDRYIFEVAIESTGSSLRWLRDTFVGPGGDSGFDELVGEAADVACGADGLLCFPFVDGASRAPWYADGARAALPRRRLRPYPRPPGPGHAGGDRVSVPLDDVDPDPARRAPGPAVRQRSDRIGDGEARSAVWTQLKADVLGTPLRVPRVADLAAAGAAILAGVAAGVFEDAAAGVAGLVRWDRQYDRTRNAAPRTASSARLRTRLPARRPDVRPDGPGGDTQPEPALGNEIRVKGSMTTSMGKTLRLGRLFDADSNTSMILPMDHGVEEPVYGELERPQELIASLAGAGVNAFLMRRGLAAFAAETIAGRAGWVQRLTGARGCHPAWRTSSSCSPGSRRRCATAPTPSCRRSSSARRPRRSSSPQLGAIADECNRLGIPLLAEIFPVGGPDATPYDGPYTVDDMRVAVRVASEEGADFIKTWYTGDPESFSRVIDYSLVPVLIAGGPKARNDRDVLQMVRGAMDAGASGIAMGRKIWQSRDPAAMVGRAGRDHPPRCERGRGAELLAPVAAPAG